MEIGSIEVGFIGVGGMGRPILDRVLGAGLRVTAFVRRPQLAGELRRDGVTVVGSASEAARLADALIVCLYSDAQLRSVMFEGGALAALRPGAALVNHVTGSPGLARELLDRAPPGVDVVDAPMSGTPEDIRNGGLTLLVGLEADELGWVGPVLATYAEPIIRVGRVGDAQRAKLVNNLLFTAHLRLAQEAIRLGASMGVEPSLLVAAVSRCSGASNAVSLLGGLPADEVIAAARPYLAKDVAAVRRVAAELGVELGTLGELASWVGTP